LSKETCLLQASFDCCRRRAEWIAKTRDVSFNPIAQPSRGDHYKALTTTTRHLSLINVDLEGAAQPKQARKGPGPNRQSETRCRDHRQKRRVGVDPARGETFSLFSLMTYGVAAYNINNQKPKINSRTMPGGLSSTFHLYHVKNRRHLIHWESLGERERERDVQKPELRTRLHAT
jgi:hypothetical protein